LGKVDRLPEAIEHFQQALRLKPDVAETCANLAVVYAKTNQPSAAIASAQKALDIARSKGQTALAKQIEDWLTTYQARQSNLPVAPPSGDPGSPPP
jgi:tetratricopeptide (TPR) repeat protein